MNDPQIPDFTWVEIGRRIRDWRLARGWSQQQLAAIVGMSQSGVVHLEKGDTNPQLGTLRGIASAFGKTLRELMFDLSPGMQEAPYAWHERIRRIFDSNDKDALSALECGITMAELLLQRRSARGPEQAADSGVREAAPGVIRSTPFAPLDNSLSPDREDPRFRARRKRP
jgi:transcriptional regulator with XRE-family HTH domain